MNCSPISPTKIREVLCSNAGAAAIFHCLRITISSVPRGAAVCAMKPHFHSGGKNDVPQRLNRASAARVNVEPVLSGRSGTSHCAPVSRPGAPLSTVAHDRWGRNLFDCGDNGGKPLPRARDSLAHILVGPDLNLRHFLFRARRTHTIAAGWAPAGIRFPLRRTPGARSCRGSRGGIDVAKLHVTPISWVAACPFRGECRLPR